MRGITSASALRHTGEVGKTVGEKSLFFRARVGGAVWGERVPRDLLTAPCHILFFGAQWPSKLCATPSSAPRARGHPLALLDALPSGEMALLSPLVAQLPPAGGASLLELVAHLQPAILSDDVSSRRRAMELLASVLELAPGEALLARGGAAMPPLFDFCASRLEDGPSLLPSLRALLALLRRLETSDVQPGPLPGAAAALCETLFRDVHVQAHDVVTRQSVFRLLRYMLQSPVHAGVLLHGGGARPPFALDFAAGFSAAMNGEKDPRCLLDCLHVARHVLSGDFGSATKPLLAELFDVTSCYFPISFTPPPNNPHGITNAMLSDALCGVFTAAPQLAPHVLPLLLEKLASALPEPKRAALSTLIACAPVYGPEGLCGGGHLASLAHALRREVLQAKERGGGGVGGGEPGPSGAEAGAGALLGIRSHWTTGLRDGGAPPRPQSRGESRWWAGSLAARGCRGAARRATASSCRPI